MQEGSSSSSSDPSAPSIKAMHGGVKAAADAAGAADRALATAEAGVGVCAAAAKLAQALEAGVAVSSTTSGMY